MENLLFQLRLLLRVGKHSESLAVNTAHIGDNDKSIRISLCDQISQLTQLAPTDHRQQDGALLLCVHPLTLQGGDTPIQLGEYR